MSDKRESMVATCPKCNGWSFVSSMRYELNKEDKGVVMDLVLNGYSVSYIPSQHIRDGTCEMCECETEEEARQDSPQMEMEL